MEASKIRIKIGDHEFEAEGPVEIVQEQFLAFKELVGNLKSVAPERPSNDADEPPTNLEKLMNAAHVALDRITRVSGRVVSLTAIPKATDDAALLIMLGQKDLRNNESVTGQEIGDGLALSGRGVPRVDRIMDKSIDAQLVMKNGVKRGTRYRLTNQGHQKALAIARELIATLP